jgi:Domain of unknown function (DUF4157)
MSNIRIQKHRDHETNNAANTTFNSSTTENNANFQTQPSSDTGQNLAQEISSSGSGQSLDAGAREYLEPKFGHSFENIKIHADGHADQLSKSINARAFTTGQDVFFREGAYQPNTAEGKHLLAHELTHTIQQSRGTVSGTPVANGVSISDPNDGFEQEASRAADTAVAGGQVSVGGTTDGGVVQRVMASQNNTPIHVQREGADDLPSTSQDMKSAADTGAAATVKDNNYVVAGNMSTVNDSSAAKKLLEEIKLNQDAVQRGESSGLSDWKGTSGQNVTVMAALEEYMSENDIQDTSISQFKQQYNKAQIDFNRLDGAFQTFDAQTGAGLGNAKTPDETMSKINKATSLTKNDDKAMQKDIGEGGPAFVLWKDARDKKNELNDISGELGISQGIVINQMHSLNAVQGRMNANVLAAKADSDPDKQKQLDAVKAENEQVKGLWKKVSSVLAAPAVAGATAVAGPTAGKAVQFGLDHAEEMIDAWYAKAINLASLANQNSKDFNQLTSVAAARSELEAAKGNLSTVVKRYAEAARKLDQVKKDYAAAMEKLGGKLDKDLHGGDSYAQISRLTLEATTFVAQANAAIQIGETEKKQAALVAAQRDAMLGSKTASAVRAMHWFSVRAQSELEKKAGVNGSSAGILVRNEISFSNMSGSNVTGVGQNAVQGGSGFGAGGANQLIENQIEQLKDVTQKADGIKQKLEAKLGF